MTNLIQKSKQRSERIFNVSIDGTMKAQYDELYINHVVDSIKTLYVIQRGENSKPHRIQTIKFYSEWDKKRTTKTYTSTKEFENRLNKIEKLIY